MRLYRIISQLHERPELISFGATKTGRILIWIAATALLLVDRDIAMWVSPLIAAVLLFPAQRNAILSVGGIGAVIRIAHEAGIDSAIPISAGIAATVLVSYGYYRLARIYQTLPPTFQRHPLLIAHSPALLVVLVAIWTRYASGPFEPSWAFLGALQLAPFLMWRWTYLLFEARRTPLADTRFVDHLFYILPAFGGSQVPYGKGHRTLSRHEPKSPVDVSRAQLAGIKLLVLVQLWRGVRRIIRVGAYGVPSNYLQWVFGDFDLGIRPLSTQLELIAPGDIGIFAAWATLLVGLFTRVLGLAIAGHLIIGCLRLFGYNAFRNTYKPLLAESVVEFWNRYYFYFKELLVEFFFYPAFLKSRRYSQTTRTLIAVVAAAFFGNLYYHAMRDITVLVSSSGPQIASIVGARSLYCAVLSLGIFISMKRQKQQRRRPEAGGDTRETGASQRLSRARRIVGVWAFFGFLNVWVVGSHGIAFAQRAEFSLALLGFH